MFYWSMNIWFWLIGVSDLPSADGGVMLGNPIIGICGVGAALAFAFASSAAFLAAAAFASSAAF